MALRTSKIVIKQGFDDVRGKINMDTVVLLAAGHFPIVERVSGRSKAQDNDAYTAFSGFIQSTSIEATWSGLTIVWPSSSSEYISVIWANRRRNNCSGVNNQLDQIHRRINLPLSPSAGSQLSSSSTPGRNMTDIGAVRDCRLSPG